ncbi:MAG TPA: WD40 repeat domain-containing protein [Saprospiraceae bacterium]|nr:WD40 repeat domain-containing protein [Lewinellaceae bacterium]HQU58540.1 WD40 repeat domain-containing protein [Saprospiraceae bacterium]
MINARKIGQLSGHQAAVFALSAGDEPRSILSGAGDGWIVRWDLDEPEMGRLLAKVDDRIFSMHYLPEWHTVVVGNMNGGIHWVRLDKPDQAKNIAHHKKGVFDILRIGDFVFTAGGEGAVTRWDPEAARSLESFQLSNQSLRCMAYCPQRHEIAIGSSDNAIYLLDADTLALRQRIPDAHNNSVFALQYTPDGSHLLSGSRDAQLKVWALGEQASLLSSQPAHWYTINSIVFHPEGRWFATASRDRTIKLWNANNFKLLKVLDTARDGCHINSVNRLLWHPDSQKLISASDDRSMIIWEVGNG